MWYEVYVFGMDLADVESEGGWQRYERTNVESFARDIYEKLAIAHGEDNVAYFIDGEEVEYDWDDTTEGYDSNMPCDTYGPCACSSSCPNYIQCQG